jgi:hypothetical protein
MQALHAMVVLLAEIDDIRRRLDAISVDLGRLAAQVRVEVHRPEWDC